MTPVERHNQIVKSLVKEICLNGGDYKDRLLILQSIITDVIYLTVKPEGHDIVLDQVVNGAKKRLSDQRLIDVEPGGTA